MLEQLLKGGPLMIPLAFCSLVSCAVVVDRLLAFRANFRVDTRALEAKVFSCLRAGDSAGAIAACEASRGPIAAVLLAGLQSYRELHEKNASAETMRMVIGEVMMDQSSQAMGVVSKRLDVLTTIGSAAPLLGMTGTVTGMIASFQGLADASGGSEGGQVVANGIAEALVTTAAGLIVALSAVIPENLFNRWGDELELEIQDVTSTFMKFILTHH
jgi:biopolymer transport protein ExbB